MSGFADLHPALQHHIVNTIAWKTLRPLQEEAITPLIAGEHALLLAPTAGGKTEAAFFPLLSRMLTEDWRGTSVLYVCPLRALLNNLLPRLAHYAELVGRRVDLWHGDVLASKKRRIKLDNPDVLLTTPESLEVILDGRDGAGKAMLAGTRAIVVDELHAFAGDDRGVHLQAILERVTKVAGRELQRVGLSATIGNPAELLEWLAGACVGQRRVVAPLAATPTSPEITLDSVGTIENAAIVISRLHCGEKRLVFCDSRARVESLAAHLRAAGTATFVSHSSLSLDERRQAEAAFASGSNCVIVATSTLELGIDVGDLDRVIQIDAPNTVASFLQRLGRTGRRPGTTRNCLFLATSDEAFMRAAGLLRLWADGFVEPITPPKDSYHLLAHQIMALALQQGGIEAGAWRDWVGRAPSFRSFSDEDARALVAFMLESQILAVDGGLYWFGQEGERAFGRRNFMELFSSFTTPQLFRILHGREEIGVVHPISFKTRKDEPAILLLGGRGWLVNHVDWEDRVAYVQPTEVHGRSRWLGASQALHFRHCRAIRSVLAGADPGSRLTKRATEKLAEVRENHAWASNDAMTLVRSAEGDLNWWTFAGLRANATLAEHLGRLTAVGAVDNFSLPLVPTASSSDLERARAELRGRIPLAPPIPDGATDGLKFGACLPPSFAERTLRSRLGDAEAVSGCLAEAVRCTSCQ
jgi:ATP-dependent Lhr-like helicase